MCVCVRMNRQETKAQRSGGTIPPCDVAVPETVKRRKGGVRERWSILRSIFFYIVRCPKHIPRWPRLQFLGPQQLRSRCMYVCKCVYVCVCVCVKESDEWGRMGYMEILGIKGKRKKICNARKEV